MKIFLFRFIIIINFYKFLFNDNIKLFAININLNYLIINMIYNQNINIIYTCLFKSQDSFFRLQYQLSFFEYIVKNNV